MKKIILFLLLLFLNNSTGINKVVAYTQHCLCQDTTDNFEFSESDFRSILMRDELLRVKGVDFSARGNEPFWELEIDIEGTSRFSLSGKLDYLFTISEPEMDFENKSIKFTGDSGKIKIILFKEICLNDMSGERNQFRVEIYFQNTVFRGCGKFLVFNKNPFLKSDISRLNDIWVLEKYMGDKVENMIEKKNAPILEIHLNEGRIIGKNSCNEYNGLIEVDDNFIHFFKLSSTKMFCPGSMEYQFMDALRKVNKWQISGMTLFLNFNEENYLIFKKTD